MDKKIFIIHSLKLRKEAEELERELGTPCHISARDTKQEEGHQILHDNLTAMKECADAVYVIWDGQSMGTLFDMGMAYALGKKIIPYSLMRSRSWISFFEDNIDKEIKCGS